MSVEFIGFIGNNRSRSEITPRTGPLVDVDLYRRRWRRRMKTPASTACWCRTTPPARMPR